MVCGGLRTTLTRPRRELRHDLGATGVGHLAPATDLGQAAEAAETEAGCAIDDAGLKINETALMNLLSLNTPAQ